MTRNAKVFSAVSTSNDATVAGTEQVKTTLAGVRCGHRDCTVRLIGILECLGAAGTTLAIARIRRDGLTGAIVGEIQTELLAGAVEASVPITASEARGELAGVTYVLTVQINGAAGTVNYGELIALVS